MKSLFLFIPLFICFSLSAQVASYDEMEIEADSITSVYRSAGKNFVLIKSKRGNSGLNKTAQADAILSSEVTEIVLVYSETEAGAIAEREEANRERWENLLMTYPELFQFSTTYKNLCQCKMNADAETFKKTQGFYIYINGEVPRVEEAKVEEIAPVATKPTQVQSPPAAVKTTNVEVTPPAQKTSPVTEKGVAAVATSAAVVAVAKPNTPEKVAPAKEVEAPAVTEAIEETPEVEKTEVAKAPTKKKAVIAAKPRKARDPKACRPPCYGFGDEDLQLFFKDNIVFTKKQRRKAKNWIANVRLQINFDGTIKKAMVISTEDAFKVQVEEAIKGMNNWNSAVKNGTTVKSEVRFNLKFDKETKSMKPMDIIMNPKASPKCPCISDSEMFD